MFNIVDILERDEKKGLLKQWTEFQNLGLEDMRNRLRNETSPKWQLEYVRKL